VYWKLRLAGDTTRDAGAALTTSVIAIVMGLLDAPAAVIVTVPL
jgi:hypothetical protein